MVRLHRDSSSGGSPGWKPPPNYLARSTQWRLLVMVGSLMLVLTLMWEARKPENWAWMWAKSAARSSTTGADQQGVDTRLPDRIESPGTEPTIVQTDPIPLAATSDAVEQPDDRVTDRLWVDAWRTILEPLDQSDRNLLRAILFAGRHGRPCPCSPSNPCEAIRTKLNEGWNEYAAKTRRALVEDPATGNEREQWDRLIQAMNDLWTEEWMPALEACHEGHSWSDRQRKAVVLMQTAWDTLAWETVEDDTVWRPSEQDAWFRSWEKLLFPSPGETPENVGFLALFRQPDVYRGKLVHVAGSVRRAYYVTAPQNELGIEGYYVMWVRPQGGPNLPIVVYALELPEAFPAFPPEAKEGEIMNLEEDILVTGIFFKRWAYRAQDGLNSTPLILARRPQRQPQVVITQEPSNDWMAVAIGGIIVAGLAVIFAWWVYLTTRPRQRATTQDGSTSGPQDASGENPSQRWRPLLLVVGLCLGPLQGLAQSPQASHVPADPRTLMEAYGVDDSHLAAIVDGQSLGPSDDETLLTMLYRMPRITPDMLFHWREPTLDASQLASDPGKFRLKVFSTEGRVRAIQRIALLPELVRRLQFDVYYQVVVRQDDLGCDLVVCTREIPASWRDKDAAGERIGVTGFFFKLGASHGDTRELVFVAPRLNWYPDRVNAELGVDEDDVTLSRWGFDAALWDAVRKTNGQTLLPSDHESFYQLLAALDRSNASTPVRTPPPAALAHLLQQPASRQGNLMTVNATVRRITRVVIDEESVRDRLGLDHYYQLDVILPLGNEIIRFGEPQPGREVPTFTDYFPATICTTRLPEEVAPGDDVRIPITATVCFFKLWAYRSEFVARYDAGQHQIAPLFVGRSFTVRSTQRTTSPYVGLILGLAFLLALAGLWWGFWRSQRAERKLRRRVRERWEPGVGE